MLGCDILNERPVVPISIGDTGNTQSPETHHFLSSVLSVRSLSLKKLQK